MGIRRIVRRIGLVAICNFSVKALIDYVLTFTLIDKYGYLISFSTTTLIYILIGIITIKLYDHYKIDCWFVEKLKKDQHCEEVKIESKNIFMIIIRFFKKFSLMIFLVYTVNPASGAIYFRDGFGLYNGFKGKGIIIYFFLSIITASAIWNLFVLKGFSFFKMFFQ